MLAPTRRERVKRGRRTRSVPQQITVQILHADVYQDVHALQLSQFFDHLKGQRPEVVRVEKCKVKPRLVQLRNYSIDGNFRWSYLRINRGVLATQPFHSCCRKTRVRIGYVDLREAGVCAKGFEPHYERATVHDFAGIFHADPSWTRKKVNETCSGLALPNPTRANPTAYVDVLS